MESNPEKMLRRSQRLQSNGYYAQKGTPRVSYKETRFRVFKRKSSEKSKSGCFKTSSSSFYSIGFNVLSFLDPDCSDENITDFPGSGSGSILVNNKRNVRSSGSITHTQASGQRQSRSFVSLRNIGWFCLMVFLCFVFSNPFVSTLSGSLRAITIQNVNTLNKELTEQLKTMQDKIKELEDNMEYLRPLGNRLPNLADPSLGANVISELTSETYIRPEDTFTLFGIRFWPGTVPSNCAFLESREMTPGNCWTFKGAQGHVTIALKHPSDIWSVSLGHIPKSISPFGHIKSAPKEFSVYGLESKDADGVKLGTFLYDEIGNHMQTFKVLDHGDQVFKFVRLQIESNWGNAEYTCLYSFKVHGHWSDEGHPK